MTVEPEEEARGVPRRQRAVAVAGEGVPGALELRQRRDAAVRDGAAHRRREGPRGVRLRQERLEFAVDQGRVRVRRRREERRLGDERGGERQSARGRDARGRRRERAGEEHVGVDEAADEARLVVAEHGAHALGRGPAARRAGPGRPERRP